jgi:nicotinate-nucleotide adenylyltransferase
MKKKNDIQDKVSKVFTDAFGRTPLVQRISDIFGEAIELSRYTDDKNLDEEAGDLLASVIALCAERGRDYRELIQNTLDKIERRKSQYRSLGRKTKVAILGGAFNPVTKGHIDLCKFVLDTSQVFDEVWLMPCYGHMYGKELVPAKHRLEMCKVAAKEDGRIKVFDYEIKNKLKGETYQTVKLLQEEIFAKDHYDFSWIIGQDNANTFNKWVNYELLEKLIRFVVVPRDGIKPDPKVKWYYREPHIYLTDEHNIGEVSSTRVRELLTLHYNTADFGDARRDLKHYLADSVFDYIDKHNLYRKKIK